MPPFFQRIPGLTPEQSQNRAERTAKLAAQQRKKVTVGAPGDVRVNPTMMLDLSGTGTAFDQSYLIMTVHHEFDCESGYRMEVHAQNKEDEGAQAAGANPGASGTPPSSNEVPPAFDPPVQDLT